jgi:hypothetical protein
MSMSLYASKEEYEQAHAARWYCLDRDGVAMLCKDEADARTQAAESDDCWPGRAPHRAVLLGEVNAALDQKHAEYEDLKACAANNARNLALEIEGWRRIAQRCVTAWTVVRGGVWDPNGLMDEHVDALRKALGPNVGIERPGTGPLE